MPWSRQRRARLIAARTLLTDQAAAGLLLYRMELETAIRSYGATRMMPPLGLSMSEIRKKAMEMITGRTVSTRVLVRRSR